MAEAKYKVERRAARWARRPMVLLRCARDGRREARPSALASPAHHGVSQILLLACYISMGYTALSSELHCCYLRTMSELRPALQICRNCTPCRTFASWQMRARSHAPPTNLGRWGGPIRQSAVKVMESSSDRAAQPPTGAWSTTSACRLPCLGAEPGLCAGALCFYELRILPVLSSARMPLVFGCVRRSCTVSAGRRPAKMAAR
jgi:hypothetical protein